MTTGQLTGSRFAVSAQNGSTLANIVNFLLFQGVWFLAVLGAAAGNGWIGLAGLAIFACVHYLSFSSAKVDLLLAAIAIFAGLIVETVIAQSGLLVYNASLPADGFAPIWLLVLWGNLALTANGCLSWLQGRYLPAALLGAIGGPLAYFGGIKLGAATTSNTTAALLAIAIVYAVVTPTLLYLANILANSYRLRES